MAVEHVSVLFDNDFLRAAAAVDVVVRGRQSVLATLTGADGRVKVSPKYRSSHLSLMSGIHVVDHVVEGVGFLSCSNSLGSE